jgi:hypothetical protein
LVRLDQLASLIRSKNAGPFTLTFDIMFSAPETYWRVKSAGVLGPLLIGKLYGCEPDDVRYFECDNALAFKASIPRPRVQGDFGDPDLHGGQQHAPLMAVEIDEDESPPVLPPGLGPRG